MATCNKLKKSFGVGVNQKRNTVNVVAATCNESKKSFGVGVNQKGNTVNTVAETWNKLKKSFGVGVNQKGNTVNVVTATCNELKKKLLWTQILGTICPVCSCKLVSFKRPNNCLNFRFRISGSNVYITIIFNILDSAYKWKIFFDQ